MSLQPLIRVYRNELLENVIPFWEKHSVDTRNGGFWNCLDRDGSRYDTRKYMWLNGRQTWMFSKLYRTVEARPAWLDIARNGADFLLEKARNADNRVYFSMTEDGKPVQLQRKIFSECFWIMALAEFARASGEERYLKEAKAMLERVWDWSSDLTKVGRPSYSGETPAQSLAIPMILLNLIEEVAGDDRDAYRVEVEECIRRMLLHVHEDTQTVFEIVTPDGQPIHSAEGRVLNPGHAIEAGWFLQHWATHLNRPDLSQTAVNMVRWSYRRGWDPEYGGIFYFLDSEGYSPVQLEWDMKLWWPHCEALYAHLLNYSITGDQSDLDDFMQVHEYSFRHFSDPEYGEWFGYLNRRGEVTHRFKGGPYKGCFHVPRALLLVWKKLETMHTPTSV
ncbi:MAG: N-acylglucosamine 2-epimerase [Bacteroidetes bacterium HLUCCA01]|nr:MAG: N-acylglucosamine 2-epimerase [Bacteroidetes bacterium HLUCCA01]